MANTVEERLAALERSARHWRAAAIVLGAIVIGACTVASTWNTTAVAQVAQPNLEGFSIQQIRFDESTGDKLPTPKVPISWRFVGVSNGAKINSNNLWFQDKNGTIYHVSGFNSGSTFIVDQQIGRLEAAN